MSDGRSDPSRDERIGQQENRGVQPYVPPEQRIAEREHGVGPTPTFAPQPHGVPPNYGQVPPNYGQAAPSYGYVSTVRRPVSGALVAVAWIIAVITLLYMLPWAVSVTRNRSNMAAIGLLNFLLGWSFIGWVVALVMACGSDQQVTVVQQPYPHPGTAYPPQG